MTALLVFLCAALVDVFYTRWIVNVSSGRPVQAALSSVGVGAAGLVGVTSVVTDHWMAIPYLLGLGVGTVAGMKL